MKKTALFLILATLVFTSCKEMANNNAQKEGAFSFNKETIGSNLGDTLFVDGPAIVINPYAVDKDMDGKDINEVEKELNQLKRELDLKYKNEHYSVFISKRNYVLFDNKESGFGQITYYPFNRYNRMVVIMPGRGAKSFETWKDLDGLEAAIHAKPETPSGSTKKLDEDPDERARQLKEESLKSNEGSFQEKK
jgi:hypothetical protein